MLYVVDLDFLVVDDVFVVFFDGGGFDFGGVCVGGGFCYVYGLQL